ncbi:hypothetical protein INS49_007555 [Diaporthe citri]|uniref:uncharacterized protein n=1 Tax=Diaporthe citri TaxID=83186 RepID=UPI001C7E5265|nr:uncharacterized protein INS49_007555 [Diaporthe citri]KAG6353256.1 hypothetical protein INS49_007555 [Diaporthe citri]
MYFTKLIAVSMALVAFGAAAPSSEQGKEKRTVSTGECNGTSCRFGLANMPCNVGSCVGTGGGDGAKCGDVNGNILCPGCSGTYGCDLVTDE